MTGENLNFEFARFGEELGLRLMPGKDPNTLIAEFGPKKDMIRKTLTRVK